MREHVVQLYEDEDLLLRNVVRHLRGGIAARERVLVIARPARAEAIRGRLGGDANDVVFLDAEATLDALMVGDMPDVARFLDVIGNLRFERAYGEMVDVLWQSGNPEGAIQLEEMWNVLQRERSFALLCAYVMDNFYREAAGMRRVCDTHTHVHGHGHSARALIAEIRRNHRLQQITAAIAAAVTPDEVYEAIVDKAAGALDASSLVMFLLSEDKTVARLARHVGLTDAHVAQFAEVRLGDVTAPILEPLTTGESLFLDSQETLLARYPHLASVVRQGKHYRVACLPLVVHGEIVGSIGLTFDDAPPFDVDEKDFLQLIARYSALALARVRLQEDERTSRERAELLYGLARAVIVATSVDDVFEAALDAITLGLKTERSAILTYASDPVMRFRAWRGLSDSYRAAVDGHSPWARDTRDATPIAIADVETDPAMEAYRPIFRAEKIGALAFIPLVAGQQLLGKFMLYCGERRELRPSEIDLARAIADHVAAALTRFTAVAELEQTVRFNEVFAGILGHDLRNPLGAIVTAAQLAMVKNPTGELNKPLSRILTSSARMARMIEQLLDFTNVRLGGGMPLRCAPLDLVPIVRHVVEELDDAHPEWTLSLDISGDTQGSWDGDRLAQVFSNLVANALQHGDKAGGVRVRLDGTHHDHVHAEIENVGTIEDELVPILFEPLAGGRSRRAGARGLGLGLFISREIVRAHGGSIDVECREGTKTTFVVRLPRG